MSPKIWERSGGFVVTMSIVVALLGGYLYVVQARVDEIHSRNARTLAAVSSEIEDAINGYISVIKLLAENDCFAKTKPEEFLDEQTSLYPSREGDKQCPFGKFSRCYSTFVDSEHTTWFSLNAKSVMNPCHAKQPEIHAKVPINEDFEYFLSSDEFGVPFDLTLIATKSGKVLYQPPRGPLHLIDIRPLLAAGEAGDPPKEPSKGTSEEKSKETPKKSAASDRFLLVRDTTSLTKVEVAGQTYFLYSQPIRLSAIKPGEMVEPGSGSGEATDQSWILCGLVRPSSVYVEALRLQFRHLYLGLTVIGLAVLALPWLRIRLLLRGDNIRRTDVALGALSAIVGLNIAVAFALYLSNSFEKDDVARRQVRDLAEVIQRAVRSDLRAMIDFLKACERYPKNHAKTPDTTGLLLTGDKNKAPVTPEMAKTAYLFSNLVFWANKYGVQTRKWSAYEQVSPRINIAGLTFFRTVQENPQYRLDGDEFYLSGIFAPTTGTHEAVLGICAKADSGKQAKKPDEYSTACRGDSVFLVAQAASLFRTVLPPGSGFAVVDNAGDVMFHSELRRNENENLFIETSGNAQLQAAVAAGNGQAQATYHGHDDYFYVTRLIDGAGQSPLCLVTFTDRLFFQTLAAQTSVAGLSLWIVYVLAIALLFGVLWVVIRPRIIELIWPQGDRRMRFLAVCLLMLAIVILASVWMIFLSPGLAAKLVLADGVLGTCLAMILLAPKFDKRKCTVGIVGCGVGTALLVACLYQSLLPVVNIFILAGIALLLNWKLIDRPDPDDSRNGFRLYVTTVALLVFGLTVIPLWALASLGDHLESQLFLMYGQSRIAQHLRDRDTGRYWLRDPARLSPALFAKWDEIDNAGAGSYYSAFYGTTLAGAQNEADLQASARIKGAALPERSWPPRFGSVMRRHLVDFINPPLNRIASDVRVLAESERPDLWETAWKLRDSNTPGQNDTLISTSRRSYGNWMRVETPIELNLAWYNPWFWVALGCIGLFYILGLNSGARRIFLAGWESAPPRWNDVLSSEIDRNLIILIPPGKTAKDLPLAGYSRRVDFVAATTEETLNEEFACIQRGASRPVVIDNFEFSAGDRAVAAARCRFIQKIGSVKRVPVILVSRVAPLYQLRAAGFSDQEMNPWTDLLSRFETLTVSNRERPKPECLQESAKAFESNPGLSHREWHRIALLLAEECCADERLESIGKRLVVGDLRSKEAAIERVRIAASDYYSWLWQNCAKEERRLLWQFANLRFGNPNLIEAGQQLFRKGLISNDPVRRMMNQSFRDFVKLQPEPEPPETDKADARWQTLQNRAVAVLFCFALPLVVALAVSHGESMQSLFGVTGALAGAATTIVNTLGKKPDKGKETG